MTVAGTVATLVVAEVHGLVPNGVPEPVNVVVKPAHTFVVPLIVGNAFTVTVVDLLHPLMSL